MDYETGSLEVSATVSSESIVNGAELEAGYESANLLADPAEIGKIFAKATIKF